MLPKTQKQLVNCFEKVLYIINDMKIKKWKKMNHICTPKRNEGF